eukprot:gnl/Spiro4/7129_TR3714_c0_g1_i1.p1 gnl/Spiro4/7129_TR3714_c0_g1~~gnl/Spiro4/7129_TR3714_c0_g1_i1.p1  ORF type:complete len:140 (+),score=42.18 gnl/Spiro4/7129_TR3714_c0_g1_i1:34-420(+)
MGGGLSISNDSDRDVLVELYHIPGLVLHRAIVQARSIQTINCGRVWFTVAVYDASIKNLEEDDSADYFPDTFDPTVAAQAEVARQSLSKNGLPAACFSSQRQFVYADGRTIKVFKDTKSSFPVLKIDA